LESLVSDLASEMHRCLSSLPQLRKQLHLVKETI
jgi:hypothetical protein